MYRLILFTTIFRAATGLTSRDTAMAGNRTSWQEIQTGVHIRTDIGHTRITDGLGSAMRISVGPLITTVAGPILRITVGFGFRGKTWIGDRPGSHGAPVAITSVGRLCLRTGRASCMKGSPSVGTWM